MAIQRGMNPVMILVGVAVGLIVLGIFTTLSVLGAQNSANLVSANSILSQGLVIVGVGVFIGTVSLAMRLGGGK